MTRKYNKNKRINNLTIKTRGSFYSFIDADVNTEFGGEKKGIHVKLEKDDNGKPYAWLIGGEAYWDSTFEALKKGAKGGRYKKFIYELLKMDPQFNSFTRPNVGKGIKISHAMFCKLFAPNSTLGRMYPKLVAKMKKRNYCQPTVTVPYAKPMHAPAAAPIRAAAPIPAAPIPTAPISTAPIRAAAIPAAPIPAAAPRISYELRDVIPYAKQASLPYAKQASLPYAKQASLPYAKQASLPYAKQASLPYAKPASVFIPYNNPVSIPAIHINAHKYQFPKSFYQPPKSPVKMRQQNIPDHAFQHNLIKLTDDMGFNPFKAKNALIKHGNNITRAIDELTTESLNTVTRDERSAHPRFETTIQIFNLTPHMKFTIKDNIGGGDCLFHSLHETLTRANPVFTRGKTQHNIRLEIVDYVTSHLDEYHNQMTQQTFEDALKHGVRVNGATLYKKNYESEMKKSGTYGTELEISAASLMYGINIYVVNINGISFDQLYIGDSPPNPRNTWYIFNYNNAHYTSLISH